MLHMTSGRGFCCLLLYLVLRSAYFKDVNGHYQTALLLGDVAERIRSMVHYFC